MKMEHLEEKLYTRHLILVEALQESLTEDKFEKFKSHCGVIMGSGVLEKKKNVRDIISELESMGAIKPKKLDYKWLYDAFQRSHLSEMCDLIEDAIKDMEKYQTSMEGKFSWICVKVEVHSHFV